MPWDANAANLGFSTGTPWLPLSPEHRRLAASVQQGDRESALNFTRRFLAVRRTSPALRLGDIVVVEAPHPVLAFTRSEGQDRVLCIFNMSDEDAEFRHADIASAAEMDIGCGAVRIVSGGLALGPYAAWFGRL
jgi:alpha-glucosidase